MKKQLTKQELKDRQEKKQRILKFVLRSINIVCYVLSVLFLILCVAVGVNSCNSKNNKKVSENKIFKNQLRSNNDLNLGNYLYESIYKNGDYDVLLSTQYTLFRALSGLNLYDYVSNNHSDLKYDFSLPNNSYFVLSNNDYVVDSFEIGFKAYPNADNTLYSYRLEFLSFHHSNGWLNYLSKNNQYYTGLSYHFSYGAQIITSDNLLDDNLVINTFFIECEYLDFTFNNIINYNGYFNASLSSPYITYSTLSTNIDLPYFLSGGNIYNRIHIQFMDAYGSYFIDNDGAIFELVANQGVYMTYLYMEYVNTASGLTTLVNTRDMGVHYDGSNDDNYRYNLNSSSWVSTNYTILKFFNEPDNNQINILSKFNSNTSNINNGSNFTDVGLGNVFTLLGASFSSLISLFTIQIIPGLTIGVLIFLPLVVTIIILVFKAVKK